jgi:hypothetical protein
MLSAFVPAAAGQTASVESLARAAGGAPLLRAAEAAERVVLGRFEAPAAVDASGWIAWLRIERELAPSEPAASGERIRVAWEELVPDRPPRFAAGERALVALEPLPGWSLWRRRIPDGNALGIAAAGQAFLRAPDPASLEGLADWLAVPAADRETAAGAAVLAGLVADAESALSLAAIDRLGAFPGLASRLGDDALSDLRRAVSDPKRPVELRLRIVALAARGRIESLRTALVPLTEAGSPIAAAAWTPRPCSAC